MSELELLKQIHILQTEEILLLKKSLLSHEEQVQHLNELLVIQNKIIELQKQMIKDLTPQAKVSHLRLVKRENE